MYLQMIWLLHSPFNSQRASDQYSQRSPASLHNTLNSMSAVSLLTHIPILFLPLTVNGAASSEFRWQQLHCR